MSKYCWAFAEVCALLSAILSHFAPLSVNSETDWNESDATIFTPTYLAHHTSILCKIELKKPTMQIQNQLLLRTDYTN